MPQLFQDAALEHNFERDGFAVVDLLDERQVDDLRTFYASLQNAATPAHGFQVSLDNESPEFVRAVSRTLIDRVGPSVERHFDDFQIFTASFVTKRKNPLGIVPPHQDWTFVDETRFWSATVWCPLVDVDLENGALGLIKGSHRLFDHVRPSPSPHYGPPFRDQLSEIVPYLTLVKLRAGQALVFNNLTLHASPPNTTGQTRVAFGIGVTHRDARLRHYYLLPGQSAPLVEGYEVNPEFFFSYNNARLAALFERGEKPSGLESIGTFPLRPKQYKRAQLVAAIRAAGNVENRTLADRMAALFGSEKRSNSADNDRQARASNASTVAPKPPFWKVYTPGNVVREIGYRLRKH